jgi:DNA-binding GntR family transcriptional regulator
MPAAGTCSEWLTIAGSTLRPVSQPSEETTYTQIRRWIVEGRFRPGERLIEQRIAEELDLSRTPVREALRMLQSEGLVQFEANRGATVRSLTIADIADLYELRARLESMAAELSATRATPNQLEGLASAEARFAEAANQVRAGDRQATRRVFDQNDAFHRTFLEAAHHERLTQALVRTVDHTLVFQAFRHYQTSELERSVLFHHLISSAIGNGEGVRAGRLVYEHVMQGRDQLLAVVGDDTSVDALYAEYPADGSTDGPA